MGETVPDEVESLISGERVVAHFATCTDDRPHVAPLWYRYAGDDVVEIMTTGRKLENVRNNPFVALSIQKDEDGHPAWEVVFQGTATVVDDPEEAREANRKMNRKYGADSEDDWSENDLVRVEVGTTAYQTF